MNAKSSGFHATGSVRMTTGASTNRCVAWRFIGLTCALVSAQQSAAAAPSTPAATSLATPRAPAPSGTAPTGGDSKAATIVPPRLVEQTPVLYPEGATGDTVVVVTVTVNANGTVRKADASHPDHRFAEATLDSVPQWRFEPATRNGIPTAATIRMEIAFHAPIVDPGDEEPSTSDVATPTSTHQGTAASGTSPPRAVKAASGAATDGNQPKERQASTTPIEVTVIGERRPPMVVALARTEVRQIPGTFGDPFRALEILPGVTPIISGLPYFYVRGAPPGNVGYYLDGIRVPYLYHVAIGPSVVNPGMVDRVDLYRGGYPASLGRYAGGIAAAETTAPSVTPRGEANLRLYDAGAMVESGFANGRGTVLLGGRYSYTAAIISLAVKNVTLDYRDYQARVTYDVTPHDRVGLIAFGAYDLLAQDQNGISTIGFGTEFYRGELRWDHRFANDAKLRTAVTLGYDQTAIGGQRNAQDRMVGVRTALTEPLSPAVTLNTGFDTLLDGYRVTTPRYDDPDNPNSKRFNDLFPPRKDLVIGTYLDLGWQVQKRLLVTPGLRLDYFTSGGTTAVGIDPRLSARLQVTNRVAIVHAFGIAHQPPSFVLPIPGLALGSLANGLQTAYQASSGVDWNLAKSTSLSTNVYYNVFTNLTDALSIPERRGQNLNQRSRGNAYGLEVFLHRKLTQDFGGILSYTLSRSNRYLNGNVFPSAFDRRHVLNVAVAYNLGRRWRAGTRLVFYTGAPKRSAVTSSSADSEAPTEVAATNNLTANPARDPAFYRIDLRLEKLWPMGKGAHLSFVAEVLNATMRKEQFNGAAIGPIFVPSLGLEGGF